MSNPEYIGKYRVVDEIGIGGMATVWRAVQEGLGREVAIKQLKTEYAYEEQVTVRFEREARSIAALQHENIIHIYDFIREGNQSFMVLEYVEGIDLYDLLEETGAIPVDVALVIGLGIARALDYAHYRGVIHRDIKPANIMLSKRGEVKLMDFGIARDESFGDLTLSGVGLGTPSYMSPEQTMGDRIDFRSDLFSMGVVMYQMLSGRKPFQEDRDDSVMIKIRTEPHPPLKGAAPEVPRDVIRVVDRCLRKLPRDRYRRSLDLVRDIEDILHDRVDENHPVVLMQYLQRSGVVDAAEAESFLSQSGEGPAPSLASVPLAAREAPRPRRRRPGYALPKWVVAAIAGGTLLAGGLGIGAGMLLSGGEEVAAVASGPEDVGYLRVVVRPWAEVFVDGNYVDTTPFASRLPLAVGEHSVEFVHPKHRVVREVEILPGDTLLLKVNLDAEGGAGETP